MAKDTFPPEPPHWLLRGIQSAIFYYVSCVPCRESKQRRKAMQEVKAAQARQEKVVNTQPGFVRQPMAFQTNEAWAEELLLGPGPPKGYKADPLLERLRKEQKEAAKAEAKAAKVQDAATKKLGSQKSAQPEASTTQPPAPPVEASTEPSTTAKGKRRASLRSTDSKGNNYRLHSREDENLKNLGDRMFGRFHRATSSIYYDEGSRSLHPRAHSTSDESEVNDYFRGRNPSINSLHPPIVSQLPARREDVAWMLLGPPSAAVMAGAKRPVADQMRLPMCVVGSSKQYIIPKSEVAELVNPSTKGSDERHSDLESSDSSGQYDSDMDFENFSSSKVDESAEPPLPIRVKHLSEPVARPVPIYSPSVITRKPIETKRRDSWQFHYVASIPSDRSMEM
ncbi:hypothetical protein A1O1_06363 [Capronia coronata CBS 617.96]|uniref:Uncharacterized protein n=1 Tax=Capronia coronata CBS 617.96 TaxID=1182541 RepID=W9YUN4_9EURO|nr:uncharacterized protein A1O1_06363 [Capronia coronata CBS 617.96]EXJ85994.1 hypothetical protein A1O1_06363 [Capronia coronata CBS 617.96]